ncbi:MAG TPA: pyridoxine 5'-phosphate synthase [Bacteroidota bacterium]|jgi:pyridoxine 5-phosphate synthase|nr:pyridoxine 5'-phosphate synthase [Bacteroidota bacterium]
MRLSINIDHVATLRNARGGTEPDPVDAALLCERAGADGIVCHLREDRRHIRDEDVRALRRRITTRLDLEMAATSEIIRIAIRTKPDLVTLVPEKRKELTTEGGLDVVRLRKSLGRAIHRFHDYGIPVSLFVDPVREQIEASREINSNMIEIHTGGYAEARSAAQQRRFLRHIESMARFARSQHLVVNAGHGLDYRNIVGIADITEIEEVSIGHAVIAHALDVGLENAVREMVRRVGGKTK